MCCDENVSSKHLVSLGFAMKKCDNVMIMSPGLCLNKAKATLVAIKGVTCLPE